MPGYVQMLENFTRALLAEIRNKEGTTLTKENSHLVFCQVYCVVRSIYEAGRREGFEECRSAILKTIRE